MKKVFFLLFIISFFCHSQTNKKFDLELDNCLSALDLNELSHALEYFENELQQRYKNENLNTAYLKYLESFYVPGEENPEVEFFLNKDALKIIERLKSSNTFDKIWISLSEAVSLMRGDNGDPILNDPDNDKFIIINKNGVYQECVRSSTNSSIIKLYIQFEMDNLGMSFTLSARFLRRGLKEKELDSDLNRLVIALGFYYEYSYMMNNYNED
jgi:hypothetical protein|tara:strand:+ start:430 stop:1068 length:639 start_codon:yes stop_codon:yes gene_type:complete